MRARSTTAESLGNVNVSVETRWGDTPDIAPDRGYVQESRGASELSKPAQSPILNLRETSTACYIAEGGIVVHSAGYVDDTEHFGQGINDLVKIMREVGLGSIITAIGFAWLKFIVLQQIGTKLTPLPILL